MPFSYGNECESDQSGTLIQSEAVPLSMQESTAAEPVPRSVKVEPETPQMAKEAGRALQIKQLWEGTVTELRGGTFVAVLNDKSRPSSPAEQVEFESIELREDDWPLVAPGAVFYWMIGTERTPSGQVRNISNIEFSRLPIWTRSSLKTASEKGLRMEQWFHADGNHPS
ncbi:MAG: hypothetical protein WAM98_03450 [Terriglobales bacterium]